MKDTATITAERDDAERRARRARYEGRMDNAAYWTVKAESAARRLARASA